MAAYDASATGAVTTYGGAGGYTPAAVEQGVAVSGRQGAAGGMYVTPYGPMAPVDNTWNSLVQIVEGVGALGVAGVAIFGSDGALTPWAAALAAQGVLQVSTGVGGVVTSVQGGGHTFVPPSGGLTATQAIQLSTAASDSAVAAGNTGSSALAAAVWLPVNPYPATPPYTALEMVQKGLARAFTPNFRDRAAYDGLGYVSLVSNGDIYAMLQAGSFPDCVYDPAAHVAGNTLAQDVIYQNPGYTVAVDGSPSYVLVNEPTYATEWVVFASPAGGSVSQWDTDYATYRQYTPSSGPPARLLIEDMQLLFSLIPVKY